MADGNFFVDTDGLDRTSPEFQNIAGRIRNIGSGLQSTLEALGECWGNDHTGRQFLDQYGRPKNVLIVGIKDSGEVLESTVDGITTMAKNYKRQEEENIRLAQKIKADHEESLTPRTFQPLKPRSSGVPVGGGDSGDPQPWTFEPLKPRSSGVPVGGGEVGEVTSRVFESLEPRSSGVPVGGGDSGDPQPWTFEPLKPTSERH